MTTSRTTARLTVAGDASSERCQASWRKMATSIAAEADKLSSVYETEYFVSSVLGQLWERRASAPPLESFDLDLVQGAALAEGLADHGGQGSLLVLHTIGRLVPGGLGALSAELAGRADGELPQWSDEVGRSRVTKATCASVAGDGAAMLLDVEGVGMIDHAVAIFIDERRGGIAKHLGLVYGSDQRGQDVENDLGGEPCDVGEVCRRVLDAISLTDRDADAPVGDTFAGLRMIAIARAAASLPRQPPMAWTN